MGRHIQQSLLLYNLQLSMGLEHTPICLPFLDWWWAQPKEEDGKYKKGAAKRDGYSNSFGHGLI